MKRAMTLTLTQALGTRLSPDTCTMTATRLYRRSWSHFILATSSDADVARSLPTIRATLTRTIERLAEIARDEVRFAFSIKSRTSGCALVCVVWGTERLNAYQAAEPWSWTTSAHVSRYDVRRHGCFFLMHDVRENGYDSSHLPPCLLSSGPCNVSTFNATWTPKAESSLCEAT